MLLEEGFRVTSVDASDKMLKFALRTRWARRKEPAFDDWGKRHEKIKSTPLPRLQNQKTSVGQSVENLV